jgi:hypothetical protein
MKRGILYLAFSEDEQSDLVRLEHERAISAQMFAEINNIEFVFQTLDCSDLFWEARKGMKQILSELRKQPEKIDCIVVYSYENLIYEQRDFNALKRLLEGLQIELISITRGEIEVECDYYYEP